MKRPGWYLAAGVVAGFAGVLGFHGGGSSAPGALDQPPRGEAGTPPGLAGGGATPAATPPASPGTAAGPARKATGAVVPYGYGELSVTVTVRGSQIVAVSVPVLRTAEPYSQQLALQAIPMLRSEVLQVHSARINGVSGATYTSEAYAQSIQSALDKLHLR